MKGSRFFIAALVTVSVIGVIILAALGGAGHRDRAEAAGEDRIVVIGLTGTIQETQTSFLQEGISPGRVHSQLARAQADRSVKGVVLRIDSPGGSIAASQEIAAMIREFEKPVVVSMADMAASGGYYIAAPAQGIVALPGTMTGSIGVISTLINTGGLYEMLGIEVEVFSLGEHKDMFGRTLTDEERRIMEEITAEAYDQFVREVATGRDMSYEEVQRLASGQLYLGSQALELGLVDRLGGVDDAIAYLAELNDLANPVRHELPQPSPLVRLFDYGYRFLAALENAFSSPEMVMFEMLREGITPEIRYQVR